MAKVEELVEGLAQRLLQDDEEIELVDVEYVKERDWYLRVFIDKPGGIGIDDCQRLSEALEDELDRLDAIPGSYILEVSSPGLDRALKKPRDFEREKGKTVDVSLYAPRGGKKSFTGELEGFDGESVTISGEGEIPLKEIASIRLHLDF